MFFDTPRVSYVLMYGFLVPKETAKALRERFYNTSEDWYALEPQKASERNFEGAIGRKESTFPGHNRHAGDLVLHPVLRTHWQNPLVEVNRDYELEEPVEHYFGILVGESFWGDDIDYFLQAEVPELITHNFRRTIEPIMKKIGLSATPEYHKITQYMRAY